MKHMKKPEPKLPRRRPPEREPKEPKPRVPMGRDRAFRAALAEEYGVAEVPRRLQRRTQRPLTACLIRCPYGAARCSGPSAAWPPPRRCWP